MKFDPANCIMQIKIHSEDDYAASEGSEAVSLNTVNRLDGEQDEDEEVSED
jgi:hypothetical protein